MDFVQRFERQCGSQASVKRLRAHPAYHSFSNKWNLPVYFQLRSVTAPHPALVNSLFFFFFSCLRHSLAMWLGLALKS